MGKFKELSFDEMVKVDGGGFMLWTPADVTVSADFAYGIMETFGDAFERARSWIKYTK
jgi:hypothetical protein